nr:hypothetical protein [Tanacetum cinerariifolium]
MNALHLSTAKFVGDFKSLVNEDDASLAKHKELELEIKRLLKAVVSQDIISVVQNASVIDTSDLQTELERMFRINPDKTSREAKKVPNTVRVSNRTKPITISQPPIITEKNHKALELEIERLLKAVASQDIISVVQNASVIDTSDLQTELERVNIVKVIAPGMFRINPDKTSREVKKVPNTVRASNRTKPITISQPPIITEKNVNSVLNGLSST